MSPIYLLVLIFSACRTIPPGVQAVEGFNAERYLGTWYEVARFDFIFERGLNNTTAEYTRNPDGSIRVLNRGYSIEKDRWKEAEGRAVFTGSTDTGRLKVSFFGPFYAAYNILALDDDYQYALVSGKNTKYLWILSRTPGIPDSVKDKYLSIARQAGFPVDDLLWIKHDI